VQSRNATSLEISGLELGLRRALTDTLRLQFSSTWTRGDERFDGEGYPADRIPPLSGRAGLTWQISQQLTAEGWIDLARRQDRYSPRDLVDPRIDPEGTEGWASWNLRLGWEPTPHLRTTLQLLNAADARYREFGSGIDAPGLGWHLGVELSY
jgi:outer membrane receptor protein involved in Fe transport